MSYTRFVVGGLGVAVITAALVAGPEISATAWSAPNPVQQDLDRSLKGDRSPLIGLNNRGVAKRPLELRILSKPVLLEGCEPVVSSIGHTPLANVAGRCLS
jgi:hypothetical protein